MHDSKKEDILNLFSSGLEKKGRPYKALLSTRISQTVPEFNWINFLQIKKDIACHEVL